MLAIHLLLAATWVAVAPAAPPRSHEIRLHQRTFVPDPEISLHRAPFDSSRHVLVQAQPGALSAMVEALRLQGVDALEFVPRDAVTAWVSEGIDLSSVSQIRWVGIVEPMDKLSWYLELGETTTDVLVTFFPDVDEETAQQILREVVHGRPGATARRPAVPKLGSSYRLSTDAEGLLRLLRNDAVELLAPPPRPGPSPQALTECGGALTPYGKVAAIAAEGPRWGDDRCCPERLGYHFLNGTADIPGNQEHEQFERALAEWSRVAELDWVEQPLPNRPESLDVLWAAGAHGDNAPFDGAGGTLAHAYYPDPPNSEPIAGDVHFDDGEAWRIGASQDMFSTALHEVGHSLGLAHSNNSDAVMYATSQGQVDGLHCDDIQRIRTLYTPAGPDTDLILRDTTLSDPDDQRARNRIVAGPALRIVTPPEVTMVAGREILLRPGFSTAPGAGYHAWIDLDVACDCSLAAGCTTCEASFSTPGLFSSFLGLRYEIPEAGTAQFTLRTVLGQVVRQIQKTHDRCGVFEASLLGTGLASGAYLVTMTFGSTQKSLQVIKI